MLEDASCSIALLINPSTGEEFNLRRYSTSIGRDLGNDVVLASDKALSRQHALIQFINGSFYVQDLQSKNGTRLNGGAVTTLRPLRSGDEIAVGLTRLVFLLMPSISRKWGSEIITETVDPVVGRQLAVR